MFAPKSIDPTKISSDRLNQNEQLASKTKKYKSEIKRMEIEKASYEERATSMCAQMTAQMTLLQTTAMKRIEVSYTMNTYHSNLFS